MINLKCPKQWSTSVSAKSMGHFLPLFVPPPLKPPISKKRIETTVTFLRDEALGPPVRKLLQKYECFFKVLKKQTISFSIDSGTQIYYNF